MKMSNEHRHKIANALRNYRDNPPFRKEMGGHFITDSYSITTVACIVTERKSCTTGEFIDALIHFIDPYNNSEGE